MVQTEDKPDVPAPSTLAAPDSLPPERDGDIKMKGDRICKGFEAMKALLAFSHKGARVTWVTAFM